jgi:hypothetical protein
MARSSLLFGLAALGLLAAVGGSGPASAGELPRHRTYAAPAAQLNAAPVRQRAVSTAVGVGGDALATASNQGLAQQDATRLGGHGPTLQINRSPSVQTAVGAAVSVGGNSAALASNNGPVALGTAGGIGLTKPVSPLELGRAPRTSTAVSTAVSIGGVPVR